MRPCLARLRSRLADYWSPRGMAGARVARGTRRVAGRGTKRVRGAARVHIAGRDDQVQNEPGEIGAIADGDATRHAFVMGGPAQDAEKPRLTGLPQCAREDSNLHELSAHKALNLAHGA